MQILITGVTGFVGGHLAELLASRKEAKIYGIARTPTWLPIWEDLASRVTLLPANWQLEALVELFNQIKPDWIFHLAGYANAGQSFKEPQESWEGNFQLTKTLYEACLQARDQSGIKPRILYVSSGLIYGKPDEDQIQCTEKTVLKPLTPYALSKSSADLLSFQYSQAYGLDIVRVRPFNHIGPKQSSDYAAANFARQLAAIQLGFQQPILETGDLSAQRDFSDVRDIVLAYVQLLERAASGSIYNVGSGTCYSIQELLNILVKLSGLKIDIRAKVDPSRQRDSQAISTSLDKITAEIGWFPKISLETTLQDMLIDWQNRLRRSGKATEY